MENLNGEWRKKLLPPLMRLIKSRVDRGIKKTLNFFKKSVDSF